MGSFMDKYNDSMYDEARSLVEATSGGERTLIGYNGREESPVPSNIATLTRQETSSITSENPEALSVSQRRTRINHFVLMKRRQQRFHENMNASIRPLVLFVVF